MILEYKNSLDKIKSDYTVSHTNINNSLGQLLSEAGKLSLETAKLNNVLGTSKQRGKWGEITVRKILELSGLDPYVDFSEQIPN